MSAIPESSSSRQLARTPFSPTGYARSLVERAGHELTECPLEEGEMLPLSSLPGWYAYRATDRVFGDGGAVNRQILLIRSDLVQRWLGYLPDRRGPAPRAITES